MQQAGKFVESVDKLRRRRNETEALLSAKQMEVGEARGRLEMINWVLDGAHESADTTLSPAEQEAQEAQRAQSEADRLAEEQHLAEEQEYQNQLRTETEALRVKKSQLENENDRLHNELEEVRVLSTRARAAAQEALVQEGESNSKASAIAAAAAKAAAAPPAAPFAPVAAVVPVAPAPVPKVPSRTPSPAASPLIRATPVGSPKPVYVLPQSSRPSSPLRQPAYPSGHGGFMHGGDLLGGTAMYGGNIVAMGQQLPSAAVYSAAPGSFNAPPPQAYAVTPTWQPQLPIVGGIPRTVIGGSYEGGMYPATSPRFLGSGGYDGGLTRSMSESMLPRGPVGALPHPHLSQHAGVVVPYTTGYPPGSAAYASGYLDRSFGNIADPVHAYLDRSVGNLSDRPLFVYPAALPSYPSAEVQGFRPSRTGSLPAQAAPRPLPSASPDAGSALSANGVGGSSSQTPAFGGDSHSEFPNDFPPPRSLGSVVHKVTATALREYREQHRGL